MYTTHTSHTQTAARGRLSSTHATVIMILVIRSKLHQNRTLVVVSKFFLMTSLCWKRLVSAERHVDYCLSLTQTDTDGHRETQTDTHRQRQTETETERETETDRERPAENWFAFFSLFEFCSITQHGDARQRLPRRRILVIFRLYTHTHTHTDHRPQTNSREVIKHALSLVDV